MQRFKIHDSGFMRIVFFGTPSFVLPVLEKLTKRHDVVGVVTAPDAKSGRKQEMKPSPVKQYAQANNLSVFQPTSLEIGNLPAGRQGLKLEIPQVDFIVVAAYGQIIPKDILQLPRLAALNIHPSLLPKYRGPSPVQATILNGEKESGVTIIEMDEEIDHGPIIAQKTYPVEPTDTFETLVTKLFSFGAKLIIEVIENFAEGEVVKKPQTHKDATFTDHLTKQSGFIDLNDSNLHAGKAGHFTKEQLDRMIRAYYPWPGVWGKFRIKSSELRVKFLPNKQIQLEGGKPISLEDAVNGYPELKEALQKMLS